MITSTMALQYFIDGYNLIWATERFGHGTLREQREALLRFLEETRPAASSVNRVTVVFDGRDGVGSPPWIGSVRVVFSHGDRDADRIIKEGVDDMPNPRNAVVVTNDREIQKWVRGSRAQVLSCEEFLQLVSPRKRKAAGSGKPDPDSAHRINEEFKRIWKLK